MKKAAFILILVFALTGSVFSEKRIYFPHFGDGGGVSTVVVVTNPCMQTADVTLSIYSRHGALQPVQFTTGTIDRLAFPLGGRSSRTFATSAVSSPVKTGFVEIRTDVEPVTATALFRFANGSEAGILPVLPAKRFGLFVERNQALDTGIAVYRTTLDPVSLVLYTHQGAEAGRALMPFDGVQNAKFLGELFPGMPSNFSGFLHVEGAKPITVLGLRFGGGLLSTVAVEQDKPFEQAMADKFWGMWFMGYKIGSSYVDQYGVYQIYEDPSRPGKFYAAAMSDNGKPALCSYEPALGKYLLLCVGTLFNDVYQFSFSGANEVSGCYYMQYTSDNHLSSCYSLSGVRLDLSNPSITGSASGETEAAKIKDLTGSDREVCRPDPSLLERINELRETFGREQESLSSPGEVGPAGSWNFLPGGK